MKDALPPEAAARAARSLEQYVLRILGECRSGVCSCSAGFHGHDCSRDGRDHTVRPSSCPSGCSGHGACLQGTTCACVAGYTGAECATRAVADAADAKLAAAVRARQGL